MAYFIELSQRLNKLMHGNFLEKPLTHNRLILPGSYYHNHDVGVIIVHLKNSGQYCVFHRAVAPG